MEIARELFRFVIKNRLIFKNSKLSLDFENSYNFKKVQKYLTKEVNSTNPYNLNPFDNSKNNVIYILRA
ncbi:UNVERIFIED_CONTAM: hypothetical protein O8I53_05915 [Campylobacter lari]